MVGFYDIPSPNPERYLSIRLVSASSEVATMLQHFRSNGMVKLYVKTGYHRYCVLSENNRKEHSVTIPMI